MNNARKKASSVDFTLFIKEVFEKMTTIYDTITYIKKCCSLSPVRHAAFTAENLTPAGRKILFAGLGSIHGIDIAIIRKDGDALNIEGNDQPAI